MARQSGSRVEAPEEQSSDARRSWIVTWGRWSERQYEHGSDIRESSVDGRCGHGIACNGSYV